MNPYLILGVLVAVIASFFAGQHNGTRLEKARWLERENVEIVAANKKIQELETAARAAETQHATAVATIATTLEGERNAARAETERLRAAARAGTVRLRDPGARQDACPSGAAETGPAPGKRDGPATAELSGAAADFLLGLTGEADEVVRQLTACQALVLEDRKVR